MHRLAAAGLTGLAVALSAEILNAAGQFAPAHLGEHVTIRTAFAVRTDRPPRIDGRFDEADWAKARPIADLRTSSRRGVGTRPLYLRHDPETGGIRVGDDPTFVRALFDRENLYLAITALIAPRERSDAIGPVEKDTVLLRIAPGNRGRHAIELVFNHAGRIRAYDSRATWAYGVITGIHTAGDTLDATSHTDLGDLESKVLKRIGKGTGGWILEATIPWKSLGNSPPPSHGQVWGLQVERHSAAGEGSSWGRNTFNRFDPQGHVAFVETYPAVDVVALTFGRTLSGLTPWSVYLVNRSDRPAGARVHLACRAGVENDEFTHAHLAPAEARRLVSWLPYEEGVNRVEAAVSDDAGRVFYHSTMRALVRRADSQDVLDFAGGYLRVRPETQMVTLGQHLPVRVTWEEDIRGRCPLGSRPKDGLLFYVMRCGGTNAAVPLASSAVASEAADSRLPFRGGTVSAELRLPKSLPEGHARLLVVPSRRLRTDADRRVFRPGAAVPARYLARIESHADVALSAPLYVRGTRLTRLESLLKEARDAFYGADASTIVSFWGQAPIRYPEGKDPQRFSAVFGAKKTIERAESILKRAENRASLLDDLPLFEEDLRRRLDALKQNRLPERGVLWRAYKSTIDGHWQPYCLYVPEDYDPTKRWPLVLDLHGYSGGWDLYPNSGYVLGARANRCLLVKPYARGKTWYVAWAEREITDLIALLREAYPIDPDRIYVTGFSMGGCGTMKMLASYPDLFAAGGGSSGRAEPLQGEMTGRSPSWIANGLKDQGTPWTGGKMYQLHAAEVQPVAARFRGNAFLGHGWDQSKKELFAWFLAHPMDRWPRRLGFTVYSARFASLRWVRDVEPKRYGVSARVTAEVRGQTVHLTTKNAVGLRVVLSPGLLDTGKDVAVIWNGTRHTFRGGTGVATLGSVAVGPVKGVKRPGVLAGPLDDFHVRPFVIVRGTLKGPSAHEAAVEAFLGRWMHKFQGRPPVYRDTDVDRDLLAASHVLAVGTEQTNAFLRRHATVLPIRSDGDTIVLGTHRIPGRDAHFWYLTLNPLNPDRYLLVAGAPDPARCGRALGALGSMPARYWDYAVYGGPVGESKSPAVSRFAKHRNLTAFGWFDRNWRVYDEAALLPESAFMDNQDPSLSLTPKGDWRPNAGPRR